MGLLSKAASPSGRASSAVQLDSMGLALADRLLALSRDSAAPQTAISLIKAYGSFKYGVCLYLNDVFYTPYALVGAGGEFPPINADALQAVPGKKYFSVGAPDGSGTCWVFPLDASGPPASILLVGEDKNIPFNGDALAALVSKTRQVFLPAQDQTGLDGEIIEINLEKKGGGLLRRVAEQSGRLQPAARMEQNAPSPEIVSIIKKAMERYNPLSALVLEARENPKENGRALQTIVASFALTMGVSSSRFLLLCGTSDRELLAHRICASIPLKVIFSREAASAKEALEALKPYL